MPDPYPQPRIATAANARLIRPLGDFLQRQASAGILLVIAATTALVWANTPWSDAYFDLFGTDVVIGIGDFELSLTVKEWINDAGMVLFFFVVGLEIKREVTQGELHDPRQAALPIIAAIGGMATPALVYLVFNGGTPAQDGWGIPMATDIAIVMGVIALLGSHVPSWLKLFLLALAIVDDLGAILVIAVFYSEGVSFAWLSVAILAVALATAVRTTIRWPGVFVVLGAVCWIALHEAHIHPTLTGVAFGLLAPTLPFRQEPVIDVDQLGEIPTADEIRRLSMEARSSVSVVEWLEYRLHPYSAFLVVPAFALANAGIRIPAGELGAALSSEVTWGVIAGLVVGKTVGIFAFTMAAVRLRIGTLPAEVTTRYVLGAASLAGIGFTVSLFVTELAFGESVSGTEARLGVLIASFIAGVVGTAILLPRKHPDDHSMDEYRPRPLPSP